MTKTATGPEGTLPLTKWPLGHAPEGKQTVCMDGKMTNSCRPA